MYLIIGLGNPEEDYGKTRHNMGFNTINELSKEYNVEVNKSKFKGLYGSTVINSEKVIFVKPQTFMNLSGECVREFVNFYKIDLDKTIVIYDDIDLNPGVIRIRKKGSSGSHNGMRSVVDCLNSENFPRIRIGIGKPKENISLIEHVIGYIDEDDLEGLNKGVQLAKMAVDEILKNGIDSAMNKFN